MQNAGLDEAQAGIKIAWRNINNLRYADDTTLIAERPGGGAQPRGGEGRPEAGLPPSCTWGRWPCSPGMGAGLCRVCRKSSKRQHARLCSLWQGGELVDTEVAFLTLFKHGLCLESSWPLHHPKGPQSLQSVWSRGAPCWEEAQGGLWEPRLQVGQARLACGSSGFKGNRAALPVGAQPSGGTGPTCLLCSFVHVSGLDSFKQRF